VRTPSHFRKPSSRPGRAERDRAIAALAIRFEAELDLRWPPLKLAFLTPAVCSRPGALSYLGKQLGAAAREGGTVQRQVFVDSFQSWPTPSAGDRVDLAQSRCREADSPGHSLRRRI